MPEVLVVGAGAAGIAAARRLGALGLEALVLEASDHVAGRAWTESARLGAPFNHGAEWLHAADENPLTPIARSLGITLRQGEPQERVLNGDRPATPRELAEYERAWHAFDPAVAAAVAALGPGEDRPADGPAPKGGPWDATVAFWQGDIICGAPLAAMSLRDFWAIGLEGRNLMPEPGMGALLARLADGLPIRLGARVATLRWDGARCVASGAFGEVAARAAIVTVSTGVLAGGVLAGGGLRFDPA
ncbi:MAG TPA: FAD-dependent oxidoreductase, partial [Crenalkalicoccus sp.]|nr:FAD-dependent oxidoreductase [Crenalkalicoccus sp.]